MWAPHPRLCSGDNQEVRCGHAYLVVTVIMFWPRMIPSGWTSVETEDPRGSSTGSGIGGRCEYRSRSQKVQPDIQISMIGDSQEVGA